MKRTMWTFCKTYIPFLLSVGILLLVSCTKRANDQARTYYEQGRALREQGELTQAMEAFIKAAQSGTKDEALLGRVCSNIANMCRQANEHSKAFYVYTLSAEHFAASGDTLSYAYALNNMAWEQAVMGHKDSALLYINAAIQCYPASPLTEKVMESRAAACLFANEYDSVLVYTAPPANDYLLMLRAQAYSFLHLHDSAAYYAQILLPRTTNLTYLDDIYYILTHDDATADKEAIRLLSSERMDVQKDIELRHGKLTQAIQILEQEWNREYSPWLMIAYLCALLISIGLSVWAILIHQRHCRLHHEMNQQEQTRLMTLQRNIQIVLDAQDLRKELQWDDYAALCAQLDKRFDGLAMHLKNRGMNEQDIRLCVLVLLGLSYKEVADLINCSPKSVGKLKDLTARKLGVSGGELAQRLHQPLTPNP